MNKKQMRFVVYGHVQGVGFRYFIFRMANSLNLNGYTKNNYDGSVEVLAEGDITSLDTLYENIKIGPSRSIVENVKKEDREFSGKHCNFKIV